MDSSLNYILLPDLPPLRILIVDDEASLRLTVRAGLEQLGYYVEEAATGLEGLNKLSQQTFDLLILDLKMPGMQGSEVMQHLPELYPQLRFIILTGRPTLESAIEAVNQGALAYLRKPCSLHEIIALIEKVRDERQQRLQRQALLAAISEASAALLQLEEPEKVPELVSARFIRLGGAILDQARQLLFCPTSAAASAPVSLTTHETLLLARLMRFPDVPHPCLELARELGYSNLEEEEAQAIVRPHISRLRRKFSAIPGAKISIQALRGKGYIISVAS